MNFFILKIAKNHPNCLHYQNGLCGPGFFLYLILSITPGSGFVKNIKIKDLFFFQKRKRKKKESKEEEREFKNRLVHDISKNSKN
jgi:hypothetical protein